MQADRDARMPASRLSASPAYRRGWHLALALPCSFLLPFVRLKHEVPIDDDPDRKSRPYRKCRLDVEVTLNNFLSGLVQAIAGSATECCDDVAIAAGAGGRSKFAADAEQGGQSRCLEQRV